MKILILLFGLLTCLPAQAIIVDKQKADSIARETASWFEYTTGRMGSEYLGQCGDYAVMFILKYNKSVGTNAAKLVVANNPIPSGTWSAR